MNAVFIEAFRMMTMTNHEWHVHLDHFTAVLNWTCDMDICVLMPSCIEYRHYGRPIPHARNDKECSTD